ncbi:hypothetical protein W911_09515 [Hyphomicrobium nitrativorans NL23]|uniref:DUF2939 domain-containing protein n=1 Tax=Hyphomicrobium nitrativorans NL23 TaxID=1029756 RepID=V5SCF5_9HYPH|nr:DUF2939 domain-containing protein [Hyphomicrobium nitrativorans]AHB48571.1 hypothetical protein W911_09515 [Hyphomicrobium nitrativorans NL23]
MKSSGIAAIAAFFLAAGYIASPFVGAWFLREAIRNGDTAYLAERIEWQTVRETLRGSLMEFATGPVPVASGDTAVTQRGLWQRIKAGLGRRAIDGMVDAYITPEGLPQLFNVRQFYRESVSGQAAADAALPWPERARLFWSRVKRAEFHSPTEFEIEMADRNDPTRHYVGLMKLRGLSWKLTELRVRKIREASLTSMAKWT